MQVLRRGLSASDEEIARLLRTTPTVVRSWAAGTRRIPERHAVLLRWWADAAARGSALQASGLPECEWMRRWNEKPLPHDPKALMQNEEMLDLHAQTCAVCQAREQFLESRFGPMLQPTLPRSGLDAAFHRLPPWARPPTAGALFAGFPSLVDVLTNQSHPRLLGAMPSVLSAMSIGAAAGSVFPLTGPTLRRLGRVGDVLTGIVCVGAYVGAVAAVSLLLGEPIVHFDEDPGGIVAMAIVVLIFGTFIGLLISRAARE
jgi:hypothetical protein